MVLKYNTQSRKVQIFYGKSGLDSIANDWRLLANKINKKRYFHFVECYESYISSIEKEPESLLFVALSNNNVIEAILPLKINKWLFKGISFSILELPIHPHMPLRDIIYPECYQSISSINFLLSNLKKNTELHWDIINFTGLLSDSLTLKAFSDRFLLSICEDIKSSSYLKVIPNDNVFNKLSKNMRNTLKKQQKKIDKEGQLKSISVRNYPEIDTAYTEFLRLEASGWKGSEGTGSAIKCHEDLTLFYSQLLKRFNRISGSEINILCLNEKAISAHLSLLIEDTRYLLKIGYEDTEKHLGPGNIHLVNLIKSCEKDGFKYINLISNASWHERWKTNKITVKQLLLFNLCPKGILAFIGFKTYKILKKYYCQLKIRRLVLKITGN